MSRTLLCPIDGSMNARSALDVAADMAAKQDARLVILHVGLREPGPLEELCRAAERSFEEAEHSGGWTSDHPQWPRHLQVLDHMGRMILEDGRARAEERGARAVDTLVDWGDEGERILHHARHIPADTIVMGSRGASGLEGLVMGSVSHKVFHLAPCSCVTVRTGERQTGLSEVERILVPTDGSEHAEKALGVACDIASKFGARLRLLHVLDHRPSPSHLGAVVDIDKLSADARRAFDEFLGSPGMAVEGAYVPSSLPASVLTEVGEQILARAKQTAIEKGIAEVDTELRDGNAASAILDTARRDAADLIVMGMRGLGELEGMLIGSVSYKVNHAAPCTCISVR